MKITFMDNNEIRSRFKDAPWFQTTNNSVLIGGAGGIGSWLSFLIARAGFGVYLYDFDTVELHNMGGQLFSKDDIGKSKVEAMSNIIKKFSDRDIVIFNEKVNENTMSHYYIFSAFDNMQARRDMFEKWKKKYADDPSKHFLNPIFIDGRLLFEQMQIFCVTPENAEQYERDHLFDDSEVEAENCTMKQTSHSASMIASLMVGFFTNHMTNKCNNDNGRQVPFMYEYYIPVNLVSEQ